MLACARPLPHAPLLAISRRYGPLAHKLGRQPPHVHTQRMSELPIHPS